jgi:hypothetical protein
MTRFILLSLCLLFAPALSGATTTTTVSPLVLSSDSSAPPVSAAAEEEAPAAAPAVEEEDAAVDAVAVAAETEEGMPTWLQVVLAIMAGLIALANTVLIPYLKKLTDNAKTKEKQTKWGMVKDAALDAALTLSEKHLPILQRMLSEQAAEKSTTELKGIAKAYLRGLGNDAFKLVQEQLESQGVDAAAEFGEEQLRRAIRWAADTINPYTGSETSEALVATATKS